MCDNVETDEEVTVVVNSLEAISDMLKECKQDLTNLASHPEKIVLCISKIMKVLLFKCYQVVDCFF